MSNAYKETPYDSPVRFAANGMPVMSGPQPDLLASVETRAPDPPASSPPVTERRRSVAKNIVEVPAKRDNVTDQLVEAMQRVFKAATARIAFHETEAKRLREALRPYSEFAGVDDTPMTPEQTMEALLELAKGLPKGDEA